MEMFFQTQSDNVKGNVMCPLTLHRLHFLKENVINLEIRSLILSCLEPCVTNSMINVEKLFHINHVFQQKDIIYDVFIHDVCRLNCLSLIFNSSPTYYIVECCDIVSRLFLLQQFLSNPYLSNHEEITDLIKAYEF